MRFNNFWSSIRPRTRWWISAVSSIIVLGGAVSAITVPVVLQQQQNDTKKIIGVNTNLLSDVQVANLEYGFEQMQSDTSGQVWRNVVTQPSSNTIQYEFTTWVNSAEKGEKGKFVFNADAKTWTHTKTEYYGKNDGTPNTKDFEFTNLHETYVQLYWMDQYYEGFLFQTNAKLVVDPTLEQAFKIGFNQRTGVADPLKTKVYNIDNNRLLVTYESGNVTFYYSFYKNIDADGWTFQIINRPNDPSGQVTVQYSHMPDVQFQQYLSDLIAIGQGK